MAFGFSRNLEKDDKNRSRYQTHLAGGHIGRGFRCMVGTVHSIMFLACSVTLHYITLRRNFLTWPK